MTVNFSALTDRGDRFNVSADVDMQTVTELGDSLPRVLPTSCRFQLQVHRFADLVRLMAALNPAITEADVRRRILEQTGKIGEALLRT